MKEAERERQRKRRSDSFKKTEHLLSDFNLCCGSLIKTMRKAAFIFNLFLATTERRYFQRARSSGERSAAFTSRFRVRQRMHNMRSMHPNRPKRRHISLSEDDWKRSKKRLESNSPRLCGRPVDAVRTFAENAACCSRSAAVILVYLMESNATSKSPHW